MDISDTLGYKTGLARLNDGRGNLQVLPLKTHYDNLADSLDYKNLYINTGFLNNGSDTNFDFYITNLSDTPLVFSQVYWIEPNFKPTVSYRPILKGQSTLLRYTCIARQRPGHFVKTAQINTSHGNFNLRFSGTFLPQGISIDKPISIGTAIAGGSDKATFRINNSTDTDMRVESFLYDVKSMDMAYADKEQPVNPGIICAHSSRDFSITVYPQQPGHFVYNAAVLVNGVQVEHLIFLDVKSKRKKKTG